MLRLLSLENFAIVQRLEIDFEPGFSVLTGETGAGKSIVLDALDVLLGNKADTSKIRSGADKSILSAIFDISNIPILQDYLKENDLCEDSNELCLKRVIYSSSKSKSYVNDHLVSAGQLKETGLYLVNIHGQNAHHSLISEINQRKLLDEYMQHQELLDSVARLYDHYKTTQARLLRARQEQDIWKTELEILTWKNQELSELNPKKEEWHTLSRCYDEMSHRNEIMQIAQRIDEMITQDRGLQDSLAGALSDLTSFGHMEIRFKESIAILQSMEAELYEVSSNMRFIYSQSEVDKEALQQIEMRLSDLNTMAKKHGVVAEELPTTWQGIREKLQQVQENQNIDSLMEQVTISREKYNVKAQELTESRKKTAKILGEQVSQVMRTLSMTHAALKVELRSMGPSSYGNEQVIFKVKTNIDGVFQPINQIASGGELSRISLALQVIISQYNHVPTLIFDEVDAGIGGKVADTVGQYLKQLSKQHQILTITHLPQVAAYGHWHYVVSKIVHNNKTRSQVTCLTHDDRIVEIARMLGGEKITELTLEHAKEFLQLAR